MHNHQRHQNDKTAFFWMLKNYSQINCVFNESYTIGLWRNDGFEVFWFSGSLSFLDNEYETFELFLFLFSLFAWLFHLWHVQEMTLMSIGTTFRAKVAERVNSNEHCERYVSSGVQSDNDISVWRIHIKNLEVTTQRYLIKFLLIRLSYNDGIIDKKQKERRIQIRKFYFDSVHI